LDNMSIFKPMIVRLGEHRQLTADQYRRQSAMLHQRGREPTPN
jgi:hypothetical protein